MSEMFLTGLGLLCLMLTWRLVWCPTVLDTARDALFDVRDVTLYEYFSQDGRSLSDPMYATLRNLVNSHLRHTESLSIGQYVLMQAALKKSPALSAFLVQERERRFTAGTPELQKIVDEVRFLSTKAMLIYMVHSSLIGMAMWLLMWVRHLLINMPKNAIFYSAPALKFGAAMEEYALAV
jgi:hypothetical protein